MSQKPNLFLHNIQPAVQILTFLASAPLLPVQDDAHAGWVSKEARYRGRADMHEIARHLGGMASEISDEAIIKVEFVRGRIRILSPNAEHLHKGLAVLEEETGYETVLPKSLGRIGGRG